MKRILNKQLHILFWRRILEKKRETRPKASNAEK